MNARRIRWMMCLGASLAACGGGEPAPPPENAVPGTTSAQGATSAAATPPRRTSDERTAAAPAPEPTAADSAAAAKEDVSPEWKMNQRNMASYADCMKQANSVPEPARARLAAACRNLPDAPK